MQRVFIYFLKNATTLTHEFTSERCTSISFEGPYASQRGSNDVLKSVKLFWDWRGLWLPGPAFQKISVPTSYDFHNFLSLLLCMYESDESEEIHINGLRLLPSMPNGRSPAGKFCSLRVRLHRNIYNIFHFTTNLSGRTSV